MPKIKTKTSITKTKTAAASPRTQKDKRAKPIGSGKSLVIVESPAKARTISKYLGKNYIVKASIGHVKDLPKSKLGVDLEHGFEPEYVVIKGKDKVLAEIKKAAKEADKIYLAPDPDREGEAIAWHIAQEIKSKKDNVYRALFNEITERAIHEAMAHPVRLDADKFNAQQARRVLDRIVGYKISPLLWQKVQRGLSAGRVQSVAARLVCEREAEILAHVPQEYWSVDAELEGKNPPPFTARVAKRDGKDFKIGSAGDADAVVRALRGAPFVVQKVEKKEKKKNPVPPFITSHLQQEAAKKLRFAPKRTMMVAQQLYEGIELGSQGPTGLITYMRTDSVRVAPDAQERARQVIAEKYGREFLPPQAPQYKSKKGAQDAHEAIRPTDAARDPEQVKAFLTKEQVQLYRLIWSRFIASQMRPAILDVTRAEIGAGNFMLFASGSVVKFQGFTRVYMEEEEESAKSLSKAGVSEVQEAETVLPQLAEGERLTLRGIEPKQHFTQPPPRFSEASLIKELEERGIGRPSTYAGIVSTIIDRKYVEKNEGRLGPTELGKVVNDLLISHFPQVVDVDFTAKMEAELDEIEEGEKRWTETIEEFYQPFKKDLDKAHVEMREVKREEIPTDIDCEKCGRKMVIKWGRHGRFLACPGYPECKNTKEFTQDPSGKVSVSNEANGTDEKCPKCGAEMIVKTGRFGKFLACSKYPECKTTKPISLGVKCPRPDCGGDLTSRRSKRGKPFYGCSKYPECTFALWDRPVPKACPQCGAKFLIDRRRKNETGALVCASEGCGYREAV